MKRQRGAAASAHDASPSSVPTPDAASESAPVHPARGPGAWAPRDLLIPYILLAVSLQRAHGYLIEEYLKSLGFFGVEKSMLYRTLRQLEKDGLVVSEWQPGPAGPARRVYTLTDVGRAWLDTWSAALEGYRRLIDGFFALYSGGSGRLPDSTPHASAPNELDQEA